MTVEHVHNWGRRVEGGLLCCLECGEVWPGDPGFPPAPYAPRVEGWNRADDHVGWNERERRMLRELEAATR